MVRTDPVYQILKLLEEKKELHFNPIGLNERDFNIALTHIHGAGYTHYGELTESGLNYIKGYERRENFNQFKQNS